MRSNFLDCRLFSRPISSKKDNKGWHSVIVEGYDFGKDLFVFLIENINTIIYFIMHDN